MNRPHHLWSILFICFSSFSLFTTSATAQENEAKQQLNQIKQSIEQEKEQIASAKQQQQTLEQQLKANDISIANAAENLRRTQLALTENKTNVATLLKRQQTLETEKAQQESLLAAQLKSAYSSGQHDYLKMLLNQENAGTIQRTLTYYQYLNRARITQIEAYKKTIDELVIVESELKMKSEQLSVLLTDQTKHQASLKENQQNRKKTLDEINKSLLTSQQRLEKFEQEEKALVETIERIREQARLDALRQKQQLTMSGLKQLEKKLNWPVDGKFTHHFGQQKQGHLRWKGTLIAADIGTTVNTIYQGKVLFSDWLKGYGLVTVIDHGEGYMSLYGHNQTLLKQVGDIVESGEPIALIGQSGGQAQAGLYFEIRLQGQAVDPRKWCR